MSSGWTMERRARQAALIRIWRPWEQSTGPRTAEGKARASRNADLGGQRQKVRALLGSLLAALATQAGDLPGVQTAVLAGLVSMGSLMGVNQKSPGNPHES
jgi:hypothetical protein